MSFSHTTSSDGSPDSTDQDGEEDVDLFDMEASSDHTAHQFNDSGLSGGSNVTQKLHDSLTVGADKFEALSLDEGTLLEYQESDGSDCSPELQQSPPKAGRWMKQSRKGCRYKSAKKMSCGHTSTRLTEDKQKLLKKRPKSMVTVLPSQLSMSDPGLITHRHHRSNTHSGGKPPRHKQGRRGSRQKSPGSGNPSPLHGVDEPRRKKKKDDKKRKQDRAQKHSATKENLGSSVSSLNPAPVPVDIAPLVEEKEDEEDKQKRAILFSSSPAQSEYSDISSVGQVDVTASLRYSGSFTSKLDQDRRRLSAADLESIRRARSDAHLLSFGRTNGESREERHHVCPPERRQFHRQIIKRINAGARHRIEPGQGGIQHVSRLRSENLALANPFGPMWERIWQEIQTYLGEMTQGEYDQFKYKIGEQVEAIISRVTKFKVGSLSPLTNDRVVSDHPKVPHSTQSTIQAVAKKLTFQLTDFAESAAEQSLGRESSDTLIEADGDEERKPSSDGRKCQAEIDKNISSGAGGCTRKTCITASPDIARRSAVDAVNASLTSLSATSCRKSSKNKYCFNQFLSEAQLSALDEVDTLLDKIYTLESRYPNRKRLGEEHPHYNDIHFKIRHVALVLWFKVTTSLADKLCSLSVWLETPVVVPDICRETGNEAGHMTIGEASDVLSELGSPQLSPKSPRFARGFILGASDSGSENTPTSSLKRSHGFPRADAVDVTKSITSSSLLSGLGTNAIDVTKSLMSSQLDQNAGPYRDFVNRGLKRKGLTYTVKALLKFISPVIQLAKYALDSTPSKEQQEETYSEFTAEERRPLLHASRFMNPNVFRRYDRSPAEIQAQSSNLKRLTSVGPVKWLAEFEKMGLPMFWQQYLQVLHVALDVMHECLKLQLELGKQQTFSPHIIKRLVNECRETLDQAIKIRTFYRDNIKLVTDSDPSKLVQVEAKMDHFERDLKAVLKVYFHCLQNWVQVSSGHVLEEEWKHVKVICHSIRDCEAEAGRRFCVMASRLLDQTGDILEVRMDECCRILHTISEEKKDVRIAMGRTCRKFKELFVEIRESASKALFFAKMLSKDLEIAADFKIQVNIPELLENLRSSDHVQVVISDQKLDKLIFVPENTKSHDAIRHLLSLSFTHGGSESELDLKDCYLLLMNRDSLSSLVPWHGETVVVKSSTETTIAISEIEVEGLKMVVSNSTNLANCRSSFLSSMGHAILISKEQTSSHDNVAEMISDLKLAACKLARCLMKAASQVTDHLTIEDTVIQEDLTETYLGTIHACFNLGFEYVREVFRLLGDGMAYETLGNDILYHAILWIRFVEEKCERGRGTTTRWASAGLEFLKLVCAPRLLATITQTQFEELKKLINRCLDHMTEARPLHVEAIAYKQRRPWSKKPALGRKGYSQEDSMYLSPLSELAKKRQQEQSDVPVEPGVFRIEDPPLCVADPSRQEEVAYVAMGMGMAGYDDYDSPAVVGVDGLQPVSSSVSADSAEQTSGVDSPNFNPEATRLYSHTHTGTSAEANHELSPDTGSEHVASTPPPVPVERSESVFSSASKHYLSLSRLNSIFPVSRSSSESLTASTPLLPIIKKSKVDAIQESINRMERKREKKLKRDKRIGHVTTHETSSLHDIAVLNQLRTTTFKWQRGRKLGKGRFGQVYECFNLDSGEINAVKQIPIQEKDSGALQTIAEEIQLFQKVQHENIVKFYGVEVHHNELYIFMEYCSEGTLWTAAQQGLTDYMIRHYTREILKAVDALHDRGVVHRDIKGANIFLSSKGSIKLGDFGLSVQLKNYKETIMTNEIKQQAGTVPYMSPEVVLKRDMGLPMDIWSVGCVVVEMATGKLPWADFDNQFTIMYQLGSQKAPPVPEASLKPDGHDFLKRCFIPEPNKRWKAIQLLGHNFVKVSDGVSSEEEQ